jgi:hypothetical protein
MTECRDRKSSWRIHHVDMPVRLKPIERCSKPTSWVPNVDAFPSFSPIFSAPLFQLQCGVLRLFPIVALSVVNLSGIQRLRRENIQDTGNGTAENVPFYVDMDTEFLLDFPYIVLKLRFNDHCVFRIIVKTIRTFVVTFALFVFQYSESFRVRSTSFALITYVD